MRRAPFLGFLVVSAAIVLLVAPASCQPGEPANTTAEKETPTAGQDPASKRPTPAAEAVLDTEEALEKRLAQKIVLTFVDTPLDWVLESMHDQAGINIVIDRHAVADAGVDDKTPVTINVKNVPLRSALELVLGPLGLTWTIRHGVLLVTTPEKAKEMFWTKVYDVADLVVYRDQNGELWDDYDSLVETITTTIEPDTWRYGDAGCIQGGTFATAKVLIVTHTSEVHHEISRLLEDLRKVAQEGPADTQPPLRKRPQPGGGLTGGGQLPSSAGGFGAWWPQRGIVAVVAEEGVELKVGEKVLTTFKKGAKLPVLNVKDEWVGVSVSLDGKETVGWVRKTEVEPLPPAVAPETTVPSP